MKTYIGIDPGLSGGLAYIREDGTQIHADKMPATELDVLAWLANVTDDNHCIATIEKVHSSPQMGVVSAFKFGRNLGGLHMACMAAGIRLEWVTPQKWQRKLGLVVSGKGLGQDDTAKKNRNKARAQELFPGMKITHAIADALLIAEYGRLTDQA